MCLKYSMYMYMYVLNVKQNVQINEYYKRYNVKLQPKRVKLYFCSVYAWSQSGTNIYRAT